MSLKSELKLQDLPKDILRMIYRKYWLLKGVRPYLEEIKQEGSFQFNMKTKAWCLICGEAPDKTYDQTPSSRGRIVCLSRKLRLMNQECYTCIMDSARGHSPDLRLGKMWLEDKNINLNF
jgi:hypothetical protein